MKGLTFGKTILLVVGAAVLAFFSCIGALSGAGSGSDAAFLFGGIGFALGLIAMLIGFLRLFYLTVVWLVSLGKQPPPNPPA